MSISVVDIFNILGNVATVFIPIILLLWTLLSNTILATELWNWLSDRYYGASWYGEYDSILKSCSHWCPCLCRIEQPVLEAKLEQLTHFGHVSSKPSSQTCWTVLPDLASVGYDGIKHDVNATVRRDSSRRVMLKVRLEDLMQLLLRDDRPLNWDVPWSGRPWRQKTGYGFVQLTMAGPDLFGSIDIDPVPYNNPNRGLTLTGNAIQELWENGYTGFPNDLFSGTNGPDECLTLRFKLEHHKIGTTATYALTPLAFGWILHRICILFGSSDEAKVCTNHTCRNSWNELTNETGMLAARLNWTSGGNRSAVKTVQGLAELAVKMRKAHFKRLR